MPQTQQGIAQSKSALVCFEQVGKNKTFSGNYISGLSEISDLVCG